MKKASLTTVLTTALRTVEWDKQDYCNQLLQQPLHCQDQEET